MKYTIMGFNQQKAVEFNLDTDDLLILSYFSDFRDTELMVCEEFEGKKYYWVKYEALLSNLPILRISSKSSLRRRFKKLQDAKILNHYCKKTKEGTFSFYGIGENYLTLKTTVQNYTVEKSELNSDVKSNEQNCIVPTAYSCTTRTVQTHDRVLHKCTTRTAQMHDQNINLLKNKSIKNITLLKDKELSSEPSLSDSDDGVRKIIKETMDSMSNMAYDMWFKDTIIKEYENKVSIAVSKELLRYVPPKYKKQIEIALDKPIELIEKI